MAYDGKIMRRALQRFEEDRQERETRFRERQESIFRRQPRLREVDSELRSTMSRIIANALRRGTDPRPAVERLRDENLSLQAEKRELLARMGLPGRKVKRARKATRATRSPMRILPPSSLPR